MNSVEHIAIIGCGFSGTSAFYQVVEEFDVKEVTIFESSGNFGPGFAYKTNECQDYLINNTTDTMCLSPDNRRAFIEWLESKPDLNIHIDPKGHLPRNYYGLFLEEMFEKTLRKASAKEIQVNLIEEEATRLDQYESNLVKIGWLDKEVVVNAALITTGRCPDVNICSRPSTKAKATYFETHINTNALDGIPMDASVHILGASLSAFDVVNRLFSENTGCRFEHNKSGDLIFLPGPNNRKVTLCSRSGRLKKIQSLNRGIVEREYFTTQSIKNQFSENDLTLEDILNLVLKDAKTSNKDVDLNTALEPYQDCYNRSYVNKKAAHILEEDIRKAKTGDNFLVDYFDDAQIDIWDIFADRILSAESEIRYRQKIESAFLSYLAPCPIPTGEKLLALLKAGRLNVLSGVGLPELNEKEDSYLITHQHGTEGAQVLINTTGKVDRNVESKNQPSLIKDMVSSGILEPYKRGDKTLPGAHVDMSTFRLPKSNNIYMANMLLWGPGFFTSSAFLMATIVRRILKNIFIENKE